VRRCGRSSFAAWTSRRHERDQRLENQKSEAEREDAARFRWDRAGRDERLADGSSDDDAADEERGERRLQPAQRVHTAAVDGVDDAREADEAGVALELLGTKRCLPCHWGTFPLLTGTPDQLKEHAPSGVEILTPEPGESVDL